jgi:hypothetical protein
MSDTNTIDPGDIYTISAAARLLRVSPSTLRDLERRGKVACTWTPGRQRRFVGSELLRLLAQSQGAAPREPAQTPSAGTTDTADATARRAWLGQLIARAQRELPADTPAAIRLRLAADLERGLSKSGPASPLGDVEPLVKSLVERATRAAHEAQEEAQRTERKGELIDGAMGHLRRSLDALPKRMVGSRGSHERRHIGATLRDQLRDALQERLTGNEDWPDVRELVEEVVAAWYVERAGSPRIPDAVKFLAVGVTGVAGGAVAAAALDPQIRAGAVKLKERLLLLAVEVARRVTSPPPPAPPPAAPAKDTTTPPAPTGLTTSMLGVWPRSLGRTPGRFRPVSPMFQRGPRGWVPGPRRQS